MLTGIVKWFSNAKGYGFIIPDNGGKEVFVHYSKIITDGEKLLQPRQRVQFNIFDGPKGKEAVDVSCI
jgi:CspA family cold shock protein